MFSRNTLDFWAVNCTKIAFRGTGEAIAVPSDPISAIRSRGGSEWVGKVGNRRGGGVDGSGGRECGRKG